MICREGAAQQSATLRCAGVQHGDRPHCPLCHPASSHTPPLQDAHQSKTGAKRNKYGQMVEKLASIFFATFVKFSTLLIIINSTVKV